LDVFAEAEGLKRRRALLERLQQQASNPQIQGPRGMAIAQLLASLATQHNTARKLKGLDSAEAGNRQQYGEQLGSELEQYMQRQEGAPGAPAIPGAPPVAEVAPGLPGLPGIPQVNELPAGAPQPRQAVFNAIASRFPEMQAVGKAGLSELLRKKEKPTEQWVEETRNIDGKQVLVRKNTVTGKIEQVGTGPMVSVTNQPENQAHAHSLKATIDAVQPKGDSYLAALAGKKNLQMTTEAVTAITRGAETGILQEVILGARKLGDRLGIPSAETAPTDQLSALLKERVFSKLGGLGVAISDADRKFMSSASGDITTNPEALKRLLALDAAASMLAMNRHNGRVYNLAKQFPEQGVNEVPLSWNPPEDPDFERMVQNAMSGRPTGTDTWGTKPAAPKPAAPAAPKSGDPRIRFGG